MIHDGFLAVGNSFSGCVGAVHNVLFFRRNDINPSGIIFRGDIRQRGRIHPVILLFQKSILYPSHHAGKPPAKGNLHPHLAGRDGELAVVVFSEMTRGEFALASTVGHSGRSSRK